MKLGFLGVGKMGSALLEGILRGNQCMPEDVTVFDPYQPALDACVKTFGVTGASSPSEVVQRSEAVLLCVKPADMQSTLASVQDAGKDRLLVSIAAGISLAQLEGWSGNQHRVVRVMPNTPALVGQGASAFTLGNSASTEDATTVQTLLDCVGLAVQVTEKQMDAVTGLSGSGPAYVFTIIEALADGGVLEGLPKPLALQLATQTVLGAASLVKDSGTHPATLRDNVTSPGGTTIAGLAELERKGLRSALIEAVRSAAARSRELGAEN